MVPSSSGPGRLVLIQKIKGSTPFGITISELLPSQDSFLLSIMEKSGLKRYKWAVVAA